MVHVVGQVRVEVRQRIVRERREVDDRVEAFDVFQAHIARVADDGRNIDDLAAILERAARIEIGI